MKGSEEVCLMRCPTVIFGSGEDAPTTVFPVTELDRVKVTLRCPPLFSRSMRYTGQQTFHQLRAQHLCVESTEFFFCSTVERRDGSFISWFCRSNPRVAGSTVQDQRQRMDQGHDLGPESPALEDRGQEHGRETFAQEESHRQVRTDLCVLWFACGTTAVVALCFHRCWVWKEVTAVVGTRTPFALEGPAFAGIRVSVRTSVFSFPFEGVRYDCEASSKFVPKIRWSA